MATGGKSYRMFTDRLNTITLEENNFYPILSIYARHIYTLKDSTEFKITYVLKYHSNNIKDDKYKITEILINIYY